LKVGDGGHIGGLSAVQAVMTALALAAQFVRVVDHSAPKRSPKKGR